MLKIFKNTIIDNNNNNNNVDDKFILEDDSTSKNSSIYSEDFLFKLSVIFYIFAVLCNGAGYYFSSVDPRLYGGETFPKQLCHNITGIGLLINMSCGILAFTLKKFYIPNFISIVFTGFILFPIIMLTSNDPDESITYQFILPALYALLFRAKKSRQVILSIFNVVFLSIFDFYQLDLIIKDRTHTINMVIIFNVVYYTITAICASFADTLHKQVTRERGMVKLYKDIARKDPLTGLYNRFGLNEKIKMYESDGIFNFVITMIDVDFFKKINDNFNHEVGDLVLISISDILKSMSDSSFIVSRHGGEEFLIASLLPEDQTLKRVELLKEMISSKVFTPDGIPVHISAGISYAGPFNDYSINEADTCLYISKNNGRNKITTAWEND